MISTQTINAEKSLVEELWLLYINDYLQKNGVIGEDEGKKMLDWIGSRKK